jgi:hypothetical protein
LNIAILQIPPLFQEMLKQVKHDKAVEEFDQAQPNWQLAIRICEANQTIGNSSCTIIEF